MKIIRSATIKCLDVTKYRRAQKVGTYNAASTNAKERLHSLIKITIHFFKNTQSVTIFAAFSIRSSLYDGPKLAEQSPYPLRILVS